MTEDELVNTEFTTTDPSALLGLVHERPDVDEIPDVEMAYDLRGSGGSFGVSMMAMTTMRAAS
jgi:hypothetical protein